MIFDAMNPTIKKKIDSEAATRAADDGVLDGKISTLRTDLEKADGDIRTEMGQMRSALDTKDTELQNQIDDNANAISENYTELDRKISSLGTELRNKDTEISNTVSDMKIKDKELTDDLDQEIKDRKAGDESLGTRIDAEVATRASEDSRLEGLIKVLPTDDDVDDKIAAHNASGTAHPDIRDKIANDISNHNSDANAHVSIRNKIGTDINTHNSSSTSHSDIRELISGLEQNKATPKNISDAIAAHNDDSNAHGTLIGMISTTDGRLNTAEGRISTLESLISGGEGGDVGDGETILGELTKIRTDFTKADEEIRDDFAEADKNIKKAIEDSLSAVATSGSYSDLSDVPQTMKNPDALTLKAGSTTVIYDGDGAKTFEVTAKSIGLGNVTDESKKTMFTSPEFTDVPIAPTANAGTNTRQIATTAFVQTAVNNKFASVAGALVHKGTITSNSQLPANHKVGEVYIVAAAGTYAGKTCEIGDMIICRTAGTSANNDHWDVVQTNINGAVTGPSNSVDDRVVLFDGTSGKIIKDSGKTIADLSVDTKNTAGATNTSSKIFLVGAPTQDVNPQTYTHDTAYIGTDGCLYSGGKLVATEEMVNSNKVTVDASITQSGTNPVQGQAIFNELKNKSDVGHIHDDRYYTEGEIDTKLSGKADSVHYHDDRYYTESEVESRLTTRLPNFINNIGNTNAGNPRQVRFISVDYNTAATYFKMSATSCHDNGTSYQFLEDIIIGVTTGGTIVCNVYKYCQQSCGTAGGNLVDGLERYYGDVFYIHDETNKIVDFYILMGQYASAQFTPPTKIGSTTIQYVTPYTGYPIYNSSEARIWANGNSTLYATLKDIPDNYVTTDTAQAITGSKYFTGQVGNTQSEAGVYLGLDTNANAPNANIAIVSANTAAYIDMGKPGEDYGFRIIKWSGFADDVAQFCYPNASITIPNLSGTMALTSQIPDVSGFETKANAITGLNVNGTTITYTKGNGTTGSITTQDTKVTVDAALSSTSTNPVQNMVINTALAGKANSSHTHDDRYYTESEIDAKVSTLNTAIGKKADASAIPDVSGFETKANAITGLSVSGTKITYTKGNGSTGSITTQDTNTTYEVATSSANGLMSSTDKAKLDGITPSADSVSISRALTSGTKIGAITINGETTDLYCQTNTTYSAGTGLALNGTTINHSNSITAQTSYIGSATAVPRIKYDAQGHITGVTTDTIYPPTTAGTAGQIWISNGSGSGSWRTLVTISTAEPSGGQDGDLWFQYEE